MPSTINNRCETLSVRDYGVVGDQPDETVPVTRAIEAARAAKPCVLDFAGLNLKISTVDISGLDGVILRGNGATI